MTRIGSGLRAAPLALPLLLAGCLGSSLVDVDVSSDLRTVTGEVLAAVDVPAVMPTDVLPTDDGGFLVLDGYGARLLSFSADGERRATVQGGPLWGHPVRIAERAEGGYWMADPGGPERGGAVLAVRVDGLVERALVPPGGGRDEGEPPPAPIAVRETEAGLWVGERDGRVSLLDPYSGEARATFRKDVDGERLGMVPDLLPRADGTLVLVDSLGPRIHHVRAGQATGFFGRFGTWAGSLQKPKSIAQTAGGDVVVADSSTRLLQVFDDQGGFLGAVRDEGGLVQVEHAVSVRSVPGTRADFLVLDAAPARVLRVSIDPKSLTVARTTVRKRALRARIPLPEGSPVASESRLCRQCHDGFLNDDRAVWDPERGHHPVDVVPERELPGFFGLDRLGRITCTTCHSAHGVVDPDHASLVENDEERALLVRHDSPGKGFTRMSVEDSALCAACHGDAAHQDTVWRMDLPGKGHPVGAGLQAALARRSKRGGAGSKVPEIETACLGCHAPHGADEKKMLRSAEDMALCKPCHEQQSLKANNHPAVAKPGKDVPRPRLSAQLLTSREGGPTCRTCHDLVGGKGERMLRSPADGGMLCLACHDDRKALPTSAHGKVRGSTGFPCLGCHDLHGGRGDEHLLRPRGQPAPPYSRSRPAATDAARAADQADVQGCRNCHAAGAAVSEAGRDPGVLGHPARADHPGDVGASHEVGGCHECHDPHVPESPDSTVCLDCHPDQKAAHERGGHGDATCLDCHPAHGASPVARGLPVAFNPVSERCLACHAEGEKSSKDAPRVAEYEHPAPVFLPDGRRWTPLAELPLFDEQGRQAPPGANGDLTCTSCHRVHGPEAGDAATKLRLPSWEKACMACHGPDAVRYYRWFHAPEKREADEAP